MFGVILVLAYFGFLFYRFWLIPYCRRMAELEEFRERQREREQRMKQERENFMKRKHTGVLTGAAAGTYYSHDDHDYGINSDYDEALDTILMNEINEDTMDFYGFGDD